MVTQALVGKRARRIRDDSGKLLDNMARWNEMGTGGKAAVVSAGVIAVAALGYGLFGRGGAQRPVPATISAPATSATAPDAAPAPTTPPAPTTAKPEAKITAPAPSFDVVRVAPDGGALVAGSVAPNASVDVMVDNTKVASGTADASGKFVTQFSVAPSDKPRVVTLQESQPDGSTVASADSVIIAPTAAAPTAEAGTSAPAASATAEATTPPAVAPATTAQSAPAPEAATAPAVLLAGKTGVTVLQPGGAQSGPAGSIGIDSISYPDSGAVQLNGHGAPNASVRVYLNNAAVQTATITSDGKWQIDLPSVDPGLYTLRADQLDASGKVTSRFETPFKREAPEALAVAGVGQGGTVGVHAAIITVQPGFTLWGIAKASYGAGILYVKVFQANHDQIRNPDLIYPGQVFSVPANH